MNINGINIMLSDEEKKWLKLFLKNNNKFIKNNSLIEYENIKQFADMYEQFIDKNELRDNDILMLFLAELRYDQLSYKITSNSNKMKMARMSLPVCGPNIKLCSSIERWYRECTTECNVSASEISKLDKSIQDKVKQNNFERKRSLEDAKTFIVK